ncbi:MAG: N-acetylmuramoyl-L-alanine amidase [Myxococcales bacterium]|nr:N-acetylmuramoyl-L-alanine amidase [Myxococcales bacterium]
MSAFVVRNRLVTPPADLAVKTWREPGGVRFPTKGKRHTVTELVLHETVTRSAESTVAVLARRGLSVHLVLGPDGSITQHGDLVTDVLWHAGPVHNLTSFGVEVVNPYYPRLLRPSLPWHLVIDAPWAHEGQYVVPTPAQAEAVASLVRWAISRPAQGILIPPRWPGVVARRMHVRAFDAAVRPLPGVLAHHYFGHADGAWLVLYAWLRIEAKMSPSVAFAEAVRRATGATKSIDLRDLAP